jgi:hypothetical protein
VKVTGQSARFAGLDLEELAAHWLNSLNKIVEQTLRVPFHDNNYNRLIEPWIKHLQGAAEVFANFLSTEMYSHVAMSLSTDELAKLIDFYQHLRLIRATALAGELLRLTDLYEAHPTRLEIQSAGEPRIHNRGTNPAHILNSLRCEARNMVRRAQTMRWSNEEEHGYRFVRETPALVPYEWATRLFNKVLREPVFMGFAAKASGDAQPSTSELITKSTSQASKTTQYSTAAFMEKCQSLLEAPPSWVNDTPTADSVADLSKSFAQQQLGPGLSYLKLWIGHRQNYCPLADVEMEWLKTCLEAAAWMVIEFPDVAAQVEMEFPGIVRTSG